MSDPNIPAAPDPYEAPVPAEPAATTPPPAYAPPPPRGLSIASIILGIAGLVLAWFWGAGLLVSIAAVITGHLGQKREPAGRPLWLTGIITGYIGIGLAVLAFILFVVVFGIIAAASTAVHVG